MMSDYHQLMQQALSLAARGYTAPNPMVGCVIERDGVVVGEGYHHRAGMPHAEVEALQQAGDRANGATAVVTLEPCSHWGRTPPCADALIEAGVRRVVVAMEDPDPRVCGEGLRRLRDAGLDVVCGVEEDAARYLNRAFIHYHTAGTPWVTLKLAVSLDGRIATRSGCSQWITGDAARRYAHELRARHDAVMVGRVTAETDDPELTARGDTIPPDLRRTRIVLDSRLSLPECLRLWDTRTAPTIVCTTDGASAQRVCALEAMGVDVCLARRGRDGRIDPASMLQRLGERGVTSILVEGGGELVGSLLDARMAHEMVVFIAPRVIGGAEARPAVAGIGADRLTDAPCLQPVTWTSCGEDMMASGLLVWQEDV